MGKIAFLFGGQGSQYVGMGKDLYESSDIFADNFNKVSTFVDFDLKNLCFEGPQEKLNQTEFTQPALLAMGYSCGQLISQKGIKADVVAGFSLGEYAALLHTKVLNEKDAFFLISHRARAMQEAVPNGSGGMLVLLGLDASEVLKICTDLDSSLWLANINCPGQIVVAGTNQALMKLQSYAEQKEIMSMRVAMSIPSHCPLMKPAADKLIKFIDEIHFSNSNIPIIMNYDGEATTDASKIKENLIKQLTNPVHFEKSLRTIESFGVNTFVELGAGRVLSGFVKKTIKGASICRVENTKTFNNALDVCNSAEHRGQL